AIVSSSYHIQSLLLSKRLDTLERLQSSASVDATEDCFEIICLWHGEVNGMVYSMRECFKQLYGTSQTLRALRQHTEQIVHADCARTGAGEQNSSRSQDLHAKQVETAIGV